MDLSVDDIRLSDLYQHLLRIIVPRPIAWVSTISAEGISNLAPFSFFSGVGVRPPSLLFCPSNRRDGKDKDTLRNIRANHEFVINVVPESLATVMNSCAAELPEQESEFETFGVPMARSLMVSPPGVATSPVRIECRLLDVISLASGPGAANIVIGSILHLHLDDNVLDNAGFVDPSLLHVIGRMGGAAYCRTGDQFELPRPDVSRG
jgi:flavin reductase (DIM6/NTAB) family NADH-FMN oxidoreductase RutF